MSAPTKETRRHRRFTVDVEAVLHASHDRHLAARTRDLSRSGICLITSSAIRAGENVGIELVLAFGDNAYSEPLHLDARVVWCTPIGPSFQVGAMFEIPSHEHEEFLEMFLRYLDGSLAPRGVAGVPSDDEEEEDPTPSPDVKDDPFRH